MAERGGADIAAREAYEGGLRRLPDDEDGDATKQLRAQLVEALVETR
jgi:hypothetical protein